jgi:hypothetical protein
VGTDLPNEKSNHVGQRSPWYHQVGFDPQPPYATEPLDCSNLVFYLRDKQWLTWDIKLTDDGELDAIFIVIDGAMEKWERSEHSVLLYDTKHGTNRYGFKVGCLTSVDSNGKTTILAVSFVMHEDAESFKWVFDRFQEALGAPKVIFSDGDIAMAQAVEQFWPDVIHLLCTFHIWKNFYQHVHPLFQGKKKEWQDVAKRWW